MGDSGKKLHRKLGSISVAHKVLFGGQEAAEDAAADAKKTAGKQRSAQQQALDYMQQKEKIPLELRDASMKGLAGILGIPGYEDTLNLTSRAQSSPIYQAMQQQIDQSLQMGQDQSGREASVGGFLRSGTLAKALAEQQARSGVDKSNALSSVYQQMLGGVGNMAGYGNNTNAIAGQMNNISQTNTQGQMAASQMLQQGAAQTSATGTSILGGLLAMFSDVRLKDNVKHVGKVGNHNWYSWTWNDKAKELGLTGIGEGVMAHEVEKYAPEAIGESNGFMTVYYDKLRLH